MNLPPEHLPLAIMLILFVVALAASRRWLQQQHNAAQARYRLLSICSPLLVLVLVGLSIAQSSEQRTWVGLGFLFLTIVLVERTRAKLRKEISNTDRHDA